MAMTEQEWLACSDPTPMLELMKGKASDRKLRLFAVAGCCLQCRPELLPIFEVTERFADGLANVQEIRSHWLQRGMRGPAWPERAFEWASSFVADAIDPDVEVSAGYPPAGDLIPILHDIFGPLPFRPITLNPSWRTSNVTALAQSIYDDRAFDRLPILADALEDAGCDNADILNHCRQPGEHVRGCWVVDLVLGKE
jgi:hypothetical protein